MKGYEKYLPEKAEAKEEPQALVQGYVPEHLRDKVRALMERKEWTWDIVLSGLFQKLLDDWAKYYRDQG